MVSGRNRFIEASPPEQLQGGTEPVGPAQPLPSRCWPLHSTCMWDRTSPRSAAQPGVAIATQRHTKVQLAGSDTYLASPQH